APASRGCPSGSSPRWRPSPMRRSTRSWRLTSWSTWTPPASGLRSSGESSSPVAASSSPVRPRRRSTSSDASPPASPERATTITRTSRGYARTSRSRASGSSAGGACRSQCRPISSRCSRSRAVREASAYTLPAAESPAKRAGKMPPTKPLERPLPSPSLAPRAARPPAPVPAEISSLLLVVLFVASGAAGLVYQVLWVRILSLTLSISVYAVTTVLVAFMSGLALGAAIAGRKADRIERPLLGYGVVELGVAVAAIATPSILLHAGLLYRVLFDALGGAGTAFAAARFLLAFGVLLVPCTLMGASLPLLSRVAVTRVETAGRRVGALYAVNTAGAVAGCVFAGFVAIPSWGLSRTNLVAASISAAVGVVAIARGMAVRTLVHRPDASHDRNTPGGFVVVASALGISGLTALGYEVLWTRALEQFTHNSTYAYSAMLATFLLGIALGSAAAARVADRLADPLRALGITELLIGTSVVAAL